MKHLLLTLCLLSIICTARSQDYRELEPYLQKIIADSAALFRTYAGATKAGADSLYHSTITIPGTFNNEITFLPGSECYYATMAEKVSEKEAYAVLKKWRQKLKRALGNDYVASEHEETYVLGKPTKVYSFIKGNIVVRAFCSNLQRPGVIGKACFVHMYIAYGKRN